MDHSQITIIKFFYAEEYNLNDAIYDKDILRGIIARIPDVMLLPKKVRLEREIKEKEEAIKNVKPFTKTTPSRITEQRSY